VVELYTRPARHRENGVMVTKPAMAEAELIHFNEVGTLEAFDIETVLQIVQEVILAISDQQLDLAEILKIVMLVLELFKP